MPVNKQSVKRDINGDFKSVQKHGFSDETSKTYICSRCSDTFTKDRYRAFLEHCFNHGKSNDKTKEKNMHTTPVKSRNESKAEQNAEKEAALCNLSIDNNPDLSERSSEVIQGDSNIESNPELSEREAVKTYDCGLCPKKFLEEETFLKHLSLHGIKNEVTKLSDSQHVFHQSNGNEIEPAVVIQKEIQNFQEQMTVNCDLDLENPDLHKVKDNIMLATINMSNEIALQENVISQSNSEVQNTSEQLNTDCDLEIQSRNFYEETHETILTTKKYQINVRENAIEEDITNSNSKVQNTSEWLNRNCDQELYNHKLHKEKDEKIPTTEKYQITVQQTSDMSKLSTQHEINRSDHSTGNIQTFPEHLDEGCSSETSQKLQRPDFYGNFKDEIIVSEDLPEYSKLHIELNENAELMQVTDISIKSNGTKNNAEHREIARNIIQNSQKQLDVDNSSIVSQAYTCETDNGIIFKSEISEEYCRPHVKKDDTSSSVQNDENITPIHDSGRNENRIERDTRKQNENTTTRSYSQRSNLEILAEASQMVSVMDEVNGELAAEASLQLNNAHEDVLSDAPTYSMENVIEGDGEVQILYEKIVKHQSIYHITTRKLVKDTNRYEVTMLKKFITLPISGTPHTHHSQTPISDTLHTRHSQSPNSNTQRIHYSQAPKSNTPRIHHSEASSSNTLRLQHSQEPDSNAPRAHHSQEPNSNTVATPHSQAPRTKGPSISVRLPRKIAPKAVFQTPNQGIMGKDRYLRTEIDRASLTPADRELNTPTISIKSGTVTNKEKRADVLKLHCADSGGIVTCVSMQNNKPAYSADEINIAQSIRSSSNAFSPNFPNYNSNNSGLGASSKAIMNPLNIGLPSKTYKSFQQLANHFAHPSPPNRTCGDNTGYEQLKTQNGSPIFPNYEINRASSTGMLSESNVRLSLKQANQGNINSKLFPRLNSALNSLNEAQNASKNNGTFQNLSENSPQSMTSVGHSLRSYSKIDRNKIFLSDKSMHDNQCPTESQSMPFPCATGTLNEKDGSFRLLSDSYGSAADNKSNQIFSERTNNTTDSSDTDEDFKIVTDSDSDNEGLTGTKPTINEHLRFCPVCKLGIPYEEYSNHMRMHESETHVTCNKRDKKKLGDKKNKEFACVKYNQTVECCSNYETHTSEHMNEEESHNIPSETETAPSTEKKRNYRCKWCNKTYKLRYRLEEHEKTHQTNYSKCEMCKKHYLWESESSVIYTLNDICKKCEDLLLNYLPKIKTQPIITNNVQENEIQSNKGCSSSKEISTVRCEINNEDKYKECTNSEIQHIKCEDNEVQIIEEISGNHKMKLKIYDCDKQNSLKAESSKRKYSRNKTADNGRDRQMNDAELKKELIAEVNTITNGSCNVKSENCRQRKIKNIDETGNRDKLVNNSAPCPVIDVEIDTEMENQDSDETEDCSNSENEASNGTSEPEQDSSSKLQKCIKEFCKKSKNYEILDGKSESTEKDNACSSEGKQSLKLCFSRHNNQYRLTNSSIPLDTFTCKYCPAEFRSRWAFIKHTREHTESEHFLCNICDHRVLSRSSLQKHLRSNHPEIRN